MYNGVEKICKGIKKTCGVLTKNVEFSKLGLEMQNWMCEVEIKCIVARKICRASKRCLKLAVKVQNQA